MMSMPQEATEPAPLSAVMQHLTESDDDALAQLWRSRIDVHNTDSYAGVPMSKFPEDLRTYEHLLWERAPQVIIEVGVRDGGSALWLRDRLFDFQRYRVGPAPFVIAVDIDVSSARTHFARLPPEGRAGIELIHGDIADGQVAQRVRSLVPSDAEVLVIEDAAHDGATTLAALQALAPLVKSGGYYVVEDTCVDLEPLRADPDWPRGCGEVLTEWLSNDALGRRFLRRPDLQSYGLTCHPGGVLQRLADL